MAVSIAPLHSLVSAVMEGVGAPHLLIPAGRSPHHASLKPSVMRQLHQADLLVTIDHACLEIALGKAAAKKRAEQQLNVSEISGIKRLRYHPEQHQHGGCDYDAHLWLDPVNAITIVHAVAARLSWLDPAHDAVYRRNCADTVQRLQQLHNTLRQQFLTPMKAYMVYHNAYAYFEQRYALKPVFVVLKNPEIQPGIKRIREVRRRLVQANVQCLFTEPQFPSKLIRAISSGTHLQVVTLDPLGYRLPLGTTLYFTLLENMASGFAQCL